MDKDTEIKSLQEKNEKLIALSSKKAELVSISAHQIRTSLSAIKWIIKMFIDGDFGKLNAEQENLMKKAYEDNNRAIETVSELLLSNKVDNIIEKKYDFKKLDIVELIEDSVFDFRGEANTRQVEMIFLRPEKDFPEVFADKDKLRIVFQNLLENAIKYSNTNGKIFIALKEKNNVVEVSIKDVGVGISKEGKDKIFEKFYRDIEAEKKEISGTGIGLFTAKQIVDKHNGKIWFESNEDDGTTFFFTIPNFKDIK